MTNIELQAMESFKRMAKKYTEVSYWEQLRHQAAVAVMPQCISTTCDVLLRGGSLTEKTICDQVAKNALEYADALIKRLREE